MPPILANNWELKLISLVLATVLWFAFGGSGTVTIDAAPVSFVNLRPDMVVTQAPAPVVRLTLRGPRDAANLARVELDFGTVTAAGRKSFAVGDAQAKLPQGVEFVTSAPATIEATFDHMEQREVPVEVKFRGKPADGYRVAHTYGGMVRIYGPAGLVDKISKADAEVDVTGKKSKFQVAAPVTLAPGISSGPATVEVTIARGTRSKE